MTSCSPALSMTSQLLLERKASTLLSLSVLRSALSASSEISFCSLAESSCDAVSCRAAEVLKAASREVRGWRRVVAGRREHCVDGRKAERVL